MTFCGFSGARHTLIGLSSVLCALIMHFVLEEEFVLDALRAVTACKQKSDRMTSRTFFKQLLVNGDLIHACHG